MTGSVAEFREEMKVRRARRDQQVQGRGKRGPKRKENLVEREWGVEKKKNG